jgi:hypothetical protein
MKEATTLCNCLPCCKPPEEEPPELDFEDPYEEEGASKV